MQVLLVLLGLLLLAAVGVAAFLWVVPGEDDAEPMLADKGQLSKANAQKQVLDERWLEAGPDQQRQYSQYSQASQAAGQSGLRKPDASRVQVCCPACHKGL